MRIGQTSQSVPIRQLQLTTFLVLVKSQCLVGFFNSVTLSCARKKCQWVVDFLCYNKNRHLCPKHKWR